MRRCAATKGGRAGKLSMTMSCFFVFEFALFYVVLFTIATSTMLSVNSKRTKKV
jgi:hypothetical protein